MARATVPSPRYEGVVHLARGRRITFAEYGQPDGRPVFWFHGTPGGRRQVPLAARDAAVEQRCPHHRPGTTGGGWLDPAPVRQHAGLGRRCGGVRGPAGRRPVRRDRTLRRRPVCARVCSRHARPHGQWRRARRRCSERRPRARQGWDREPRGTNPGTDQPIPTAHGRRTVARPEGDEARGRPRVRALLPHLAGG